MSHTTRNSNYPQKSRKNTKNATERPQGSSALKNKGFKAHKSKNMRPERSKGSKNHTNISAPRSNQDRKGPAQGNPKGNPRENPKGNTRGNARRNNSGNANGNGHWIWGHHAAEAALANRKRTFHKIFMTPKCAARLKLDPARPVNATGIQIVTPAEIDNLLPEGAVHQGVALSCAPLPSHDLETVANEAKGLLIVLDQITDPHNVGAIFRLARAFNAKAIIMQSRNAPPLAGAVTKVAVGTVEHVPHVLVTNIANTLLELQKMNWRITGLAGEANITLQQAFNNSDAEVVVLGAEGPGLRKRVRDCCDQLAKIPMPGGAESLNVSTAAAIALYEAVRDQD